MKKMNKKRYFLFFTWFFIFMLPIMAYLQLTINFYADRYINGNYYLTFIMWDMIVVLFNSLILSFAIFHNQIWMECINHRLCNNKTKSLKEIRKEVKDFFNYYERENIFWLDLSKLFKNFKKDFGHIENLNFTGLIIYYKIADLYDDDNTNFYKSVILDLIDQYLIILPEGKIYLNKLKKYNLLDKYEQFRLFRI